MTRPVSAAVLACLLALLAGLASAGAPPDRADMNAYPADRILPFWRQYTGEGSGAELPFMPAYRIEPAPDGPTASSGFWLEGQDGRLHPLGVDAEGYLQLPPEARQAGEMTRQTRVWHAAGIALPAIRLEIHLQLDPAERYQVADLAAAVAAMDRFQRRAMGLAALMAPRFDVIVFRFDGAAPDGWIVTGDGRRRELSAFHDTLSVRMTGRAARSGGTVMLGSAPRRVVLEAR